MGWGDFGNTLSEAASGAASGIAGMDFGGLSDMQIPQMDMPTFGTDLGAADTVIGTAGADLFGAGKIGDIGKLSLAGVNGAGAGGNEPGFLQKIGLATKDGGINMKGAEGLYNIGTGAFKTFQDYKAYKDQKQRWDEMKNFQMAQADKADKYNKANLDMAQGRARLKGWIK